MIEEGAPFCVAHVRTPFLSRTETFIHEGLVRPYGRIRPTVFTEQRIHSDLFPYPRVVDCSVPRFSPRWYLSQAVQRLAGIPRPALCRELLRWNARLLHAHFGEEAWHLLEVKRRLGLPMVSTFYGYDASELMQSPLWRDRYRELFQEGEMFLVEGSCMKRRLMSAGCPEEKVRLRRIPVDLEKIPFRERSPKMKGPVSFLSCGRFIEKKGHRYALRAFHLLAEDGVDGWIFRVIGNGPLNDELSDYVRRNGLEGRVEFLGPKTHAEFLSELDRADVFVAPSVTAANGDTEGGAPTVVLEAQAAGLPVVSTRHADIPEVVVENESALLSDERDVDGLARNLKRMAREPDLWAPFGRRGRRHMEEHHDMAHAARELERIYLDVLGFKEGPRTSTEPPPFVPSSSHEAPIDVLGGFASEELDDVLPRLSLFSDGAWRCFLSLGRTHRLVSLEGPGGGAASLSAAADVREVWAGLPSPAEAQKVERIAARLGLGNVHVFVWDPAARWPFEDGAFDVGAIHGYKPTADGPGEDFRMRELSRVLKSGGEAYVDGHAGWASLGLKGRRSDFPAFSINRALKAEGFHFRGWLRSWRSIGKPYQMRVFWGKAFSFSRMRAFLGACAAGDALGLVLRKGANVGGRPPMFASLSSEKDPDTVHLGSGGVYRLQTERFVFRCPYSREAAARCRTNAAALQKLEPLSFSFGVPRFVGEERRNGRPCFVETRLQGSGVPYLRWRRTEFDALRPRARRVLEEIQSKTRRLAVLDDEWFDRLFAGPLNRAAEASEPELRSELEEVRDQLRKQWKGRSLPLVRCHGDFKAANLLLDRRGRITGLVDWDMTEEEGLPLTDVLSYEAFERSVQRGIPFGRALFETGLDLPPDAAWEGFSPGELWAPSALLALAKFSVAGAGQGHRVSRAWREERLPKYLRCACRRVLSRNDPPVPALV